MILNRPNRYNIFLFCYGNVRGFECKLTQCSLWSFACHKFGIGSLINQRLVIYYRSALVCLLYDVCNTLQILNKTSTVDVQAHHVCKTSIILISADWT